MTRRCHPASRHATSRSGLWSLLAAATSSIAVPGLLGAGDWADGFEGYASGSAIAGQGIWRTWSGPAGTAEDASVSGARAATGDRSLKINGTSDIVALFHKDNGNAISGGQWVVKAKVFVPSDQTGNVWFILLSRFAADNWRWEVQIRMSAEKEGVVQHDGAGRIQGGLPIIKDRWVEIVAAIDLDRGRVTTFYDGEPLVVGAPWSLPRIEAIDLWGENTSPCHYDDVSVCEGVERCGVPEIPAGYQFQRGDSNSNGIYDIGDCIYSLNFLFAMGPRPLCLDAADSNDDGGINIADPIKVLNVLFDGARFPSPYEECGSDPTLDDLTPCTYPQDLCP